MIDSAAINFFSNELVLANLLKYILPERLIKMSLVIVGGNERMVRTYRDIGREYGFRVKVFPKESSSMKKKIGRPDLLVFFTGTVSHKMVISASQEAKRNRIPIAHIHTSSANALETLLAEKFGRL